MRHRWLTTCCSAAGLLLIASACAPGDVPEAERSPSSESVQLPGRWVRVPLGDVADTSVWHSVRSIAVTTTGAVLLLGDFGSDPAGGLRAHVLAPAVDTIVSFGRTGEGPGELSGLSIAIGDSAGFAIINLGRQVLLRVDPTGGLRDEQRLELLTNAPLALSAAGVDVQSLRPSAQGDTPVVTRLAPGSPARTVLAQRDLASTANSNPTSPRRPALLPFATTRRGDRIAFLRPGTYTIVERNAEGEDFRTMTREVEAPLRLPEEVAQLRRALESDLATTGGDVPRASALRARLDTLDRERLPHLVWPGLFFDQHDRLWAVGRTADSTFVDAFVGGAFAGRQVLPCRAAGPRVSLVGEWLALVCDRSEREDAPYEVQLWRIVEVGATSAQVP